MAFLFVIPLKLSTRIAIENLSTEFTENKYFQHLRKTSQESHAVSAADISDILVVWTIFKSPK